jgi:hypothetical protein
MVIATRKDACEKLPERGDIITKRDIAETANCISNQPSDYAIDNPISEHHIAFRTHDKTRSKLATQVARNRQDANKTYMH